MAGRYNAVERFLRLLRLSRFAVRVRLVGASHEAGDLLVEGLLALAGRLRPLYRCQDVGFKTEGGRRSLPWSWSPSCSLLESW